MQSAFGVEHGDVSKSLVPAHIGPRGGSWIKATQLTTQERAGMKTNFSRKRRVRGILGNLDAKGSKR